MAEAGAFFVICCVWAGEKAPGVKRRRAAAAGAASVPNYRSRIGCTVGCTSCAARTHESTATWRGVPLCGAGFVQLIVGVALLAVCGDRWSRDLSCFVVSVLWGGEYDWLHDDGASRSAKALHLE